jgi:hypothetical protein
MSCGSIRHTALPRLFSFFIGMSAFTGLDADAGQSAVNSAITGGAALVTNLSASGESSQTLRKIIDLAIEEYKKTRMANVLSFSIDEDLSVVMSRAKTYLF